MTIATADASGQPAARMVLLKGHGRDGFIFYTNQESRKAADIAANPKAAILFHWKSLRRQIRIEGSLSTVDDATADAYFATRGRDSQLGAWVSDQSRPLGLVTGDVTFIGPDRTVVAQLLGHETVMDSALHQSFKPKSGNLYRLKSSSAA